MQYLECTVQTEENVNGTSQSTWLSSSWVGSRVDFEAALISFKKAFRLELMSGYANCIDEWDLKMWHFFSGSWYPFVIVAEFW